MRLLNSVMDDQNTYEFPFSFFNWHGKYVEAFLMANKKTNVNGVIIGVFCFLQIASVENSFKADVSFIFFYVVETF
jgi:hypothetical protein